MNDGVSGVSVRIVSSWEFQFPEGWHITAKLYLCIVPLALVYFSYTFIENPDIPRTKKEEICYSVKRACGLIWHSASGGGICLFALRMSGLGITKAGTKEHV